MFVDARQHRQENVLVGAYVSSFGNVEMEFPLDGSKTEDLDSNGLPLYFVTTKDADKIYMTEVRGAWKFEHVMFAVSDSEIRRRTKNVSASVGDAGAEIESVMLRA